jgi:transposase
MEGVVLMVAQAKYPVELRSRAVRMYRTSRPQPSIRGLADKLGVHPEALRGWIRKDEADRGVRAPRTRKGAADLVATGSAAEDAVVIAEMEKELRELRRANEILRAASAYFAAQLDQTGRRS